MTTQKKLAVQKMFNEVNNKTKTAIHFGISARTVGRIVQEMSTSLIKEDLSIESKLAALMTEIDSLKKLVEKPFDSSASRVVYIRHRKLPNMDILGGEILTVNSNDYSNPYRYNPGASYINIYGVPTLYSHFSEFKITPDFLLRHPVSPECKVFPYTDNGEKMPKDPPPGEHCKCNDCQEWRRLLGIQKKLELARETSAGDYAAFHVSKLRN